MCAFLAWAASSFANQGLADHGWPDSDALMETPAAPASHSVHILDNFSLLETLEERGAAQHLLQGLAAEMLHGDALLLATPYFESVNTLSFLTSPFVQHIQGIAAPHFHIATMAVFHTINIEISFAIAHLVRAV